MLWGYYARYQAYWKSLGDARKTAYDVSFIRIHLGGNVGRLLLEKHALITSESMGKPLLKGQS